MCILFCFFLIVAIMCIFWGMIAIDCIHWIANLQRGHIKFVQNILCVCPSISIFFLCNRGFFRGKVYYFCQTVSCGHYNISENEIHFEIPYGQYNYIPPFLKFCNLMYDSRRKEEFHFFKVLHNEIVIVLGQAIASI